MNHLYIFDMEINKNISHSIDIVLTLNSMLKYFTCFAFSAYITLLTSRKRVRPDQSTSAFDTSMQQANGMVQNTHAPGDPNECATNSHRNAESDL